MLVRFAWTAAVAAMALTGPPTAARAATEAVDVGRALAETHCSRCHAIGRDGASPMAGAPPFRELERLYPIETLAEALAEGIVTGHPQMPVFAFSAGEVDALLAYLEGLR